jgi:hypothetical protein
MHKIGEKRFIMTNTNTFATMITDNRYMANAQLVASDFKANEWKMYRQLCTTMVNESMGVYKNSSDFTAFDTAIVGLFAMFGMNDATKGIFRYRIRLAVACIQMKKEYSIAYKDARKELSEAKKTYNTKAELVTEDMTEEAEEVKALALAEEKVKECEDKLDDLANTPNNVWWNPQKLNSKKDKDLAIARKHIEDTIADIIFERSNMTEEDLKIEKGQLDGGRKVAEKIKKEKAANVEA